ncbi:C40 family peptidase [Cereibacter sphaeroides]|uniref:C40 family peptidase n=1 Tax=Cereibacter sphaeroides TaxID=1063 RepID=UPI001F1F01C1|nr:C40 family peptidase [Cereibacter sphaeroides]MCE6960877.1 C40 family peptidase [Cereibacter sphaeroides]MCE6969825.1 C40 family peptidase [Cereibacter sphaeroides]MCE6975300.1 C40 family peptidase [Cereibacter sphaeroides]
MDRRLTPFSGQVAHVSLKDMVRAERFTEGEPAAVAVPLADLLSSPGGARDRQLLMGDAFLVIDRCDGHAFGQSAKDGYCGWVAEEALGPAAQPTHVVAVPATHLYPEPRVQARELAGLSFGARVVVIGEARNFLETTAGWCPAMHLRPVDAPFDDPVEVARLFFGTPYLWGGNSRAGIDCSGLAQAALLACGIDCPGDSDLQQRIGTEVAEGDLRRGDLLFWKGHVAIAVDAERMIHATGYVMGVIEEEIATAVARITAEGGGPVVARRRP